MYKSVKPCNPQAYKTQYTLGNDWEGGNRMGTVNGANNIQISTVFCQLKGEGKALNSAERKGCLSENALFILTSGFIMFIYYLLVVFTYRLLQSTVCVSPAR